MRKSEEQQFFLEFIELYHTLPALWDTYSKKTSDKKLKCEQYSILMRKYNEWDPKATLEDMKKKINTLRTSYRREMKRLSQLNKSGDVAQDYAEANLYYYKAMDFLRDCESSTQPINSTESRHNLEDESKPKKKKLNSSTDELVRLATQRLKLPTGSCHQIGNVWGDKLSKMDRNQRIIAERVINEVMFNGELGLLTFNTALTNINSVYNTNSSSSLHNRNKIIANSNESSIHSPNMSHYTSKEPNEQICSTSRLNYASSLLINTEAVTDHEQEDTEESFIVAEFDPLDNAIKMED